MRVELTFLGLQPSAYPICHQHKVVATDGIEPVNLFLMREALYHLSYVAMGYPSGFDPEPPRSQRGVQSHYTKGTIVAGQPRLERGNAALEAASFPISLLTHPKTTMLFSCQRSDTSTTGH